MRRASVQPATAWRTVARQAVTVGLITSFLACGAVPERSDGDAAGTGDDSIAAWLTRNAIVLDANGGPADVAPLARRLGGVRVVGLGEATHGSREISLLKHRLVEGLVREQGFTLFAIEASWPAAAAVDDYVRHGRGELAKVVTGLGFWSLDTEELAAVVEWMRRYNASVPPERQVRFAGFDMQRIEPGIATLTAYVRSAAPDIAGRTDSLLAAVQNVTTSTSTSALTGLHELLGYLTLHEAELARRTTSAELEDAVQMLRIVIQYVDVFGGGTPSRSRDHYMAENIRYLLEKAPPGTRALLWGHNAHIWVGPVSPGVPAIGQHLRNWLGDAYYALGTAFNRGSFLARDWDETSDRYRDLAEFTLGPAPETSMEWQLAQAGPAWYVVDLRSAPRDGPVGAWLSTRRPMRTIPTMFATHWPEERYTVAIALADHFDGIAFLDRIEAARPQPNR